MSSARRGRVQAEMRRSIEERAAWYARQYKQSPRHTIEEEHVRYLGDLKRSLHAMVREARRAAGRSAASRGEAKSPIRAMP